MRVPTRRARGCYHFHCSHFKRLKCLGLLDAAPHNYRNLVGKPFLTRSLYSFLFLIPLIQNFLKLALLCSRVTFTNPIAKTTGRHQPANAKGLTTKRFCDIRNRADMARQLPLIFFAVNAASRINKNYKSFTIFTSNQGGLTLKSSLKITALVVCAFSLAGTLNAQNSNGGMVAVLDVAKVFEGNTVFTNRMEAIKTEATEFKSQMEAEQLAIQQQAEGLKSLNQGSPEFNALQAELEQKTATLRTKAQQTNTALLNKEAQIYYDTYQQMQTTVADLASKYNITLIIRWDSKPIDPTKRDEVIKGVNRNIVYQKDLDLTSLVIDNMGALSTADRGGNLNK